MKPRMKVTTHDVRMTVPRAFADSVHDLAVRNRWSKKQQLRYFAQSGMFLIDQTYLWRAAWYHRFWETVVAQYPRVAKTVMLDMDAEGGPGMVEALLGSAVVEQSAVVEHG